jgi:predicted dehydrogenase
MMVFDDMNPTDKIFLYDKGVTKELVEGTLDEFQLAIRVGDVFIPKIDYKEPLKEECLHFVNCLKKNEKPKTDGWNGYRVVKVLEAAEKSLKEEKEIEIAF